MFVRARRMCLILWNLDHAIVSPAPSLLVSVVSKCEVSAQDCDALVIVVFSGQALGGAVGEAGDVRPFCPY